MFSAFQVGEDWSQPIIIDTVDYLAQTVATLAVCFDPEIIVLSGGVARFADLLIDLIGKRIDGVIPIRPKLVTSHLGSKAAVLGTIIEILYNTTDVYMVRKLS